MDELKTLIKELEYEPPHSLARQRLRLAQETTAAPRDRRWRRLLPFGRHTRLERPLLSGRRLAMGAAVAAAVAVGVAVPSLLGSAKPAYALTKNQDGSINLKIYDFRDPEHLERELADWGVSADIIYLPLGKRCGNNRAPFLKGDNFGLTEEELSSSDAAAQARLRERLQKSISYQAIRPQDGITIYPRHIKPGQIAMIEVMENPVKPTVESPGVAWQFSGRLTTGPIEPCKVVADPSANDIGDATPPPGS
ncbi:hypothetical protein [Nonomuraea sp. WAC 01424]|uniref:hypothetical protein n=1 Tax=Nonomuraea sp. WAC 01424 TaxID=2203200 RepID=UPI000F7846C8|nr:hypothetical protein [Nonomuraea sp. WAC 01424]